MERASLKIYVRVKSEEHNDTITTSKDLHEIKISDAQERASHTFDFYRVFLQDSNQEEIYDTTCRPLVDHMMDGFDATLFVYGPTDSGKSFTLFGGEGFHNRGMFLRAMETIFEESQRLSYQKDIRIKMQMLELYGDKIRDLGLAYKDAHAINVFPNQQLDIEESMGRVMIGSASEFEVRTPDEANGVVNQGFELRAACEAKSGKYSTRAHTIIAITLSQKYKTAEWDQLTSSTLYFVDLAGSEKPKTRKGKEFYESLNASSSFHALSKVLATLNSSQTSYRDHKLTRILENGMSNNAMISMIVCVNPDKVQFEDTLASLTFADRCKPLTAGGAAFFASDKLTGNEVDMKIKLLQDERAELKEKLRKIEMTQEEQLKKIVDMLGIEGDVDTLLQAQPGSRELAKINQQKEAVQKVDSLIKKNKELEKKVEENKQIFEKIKKAENQSQEQHLRKVLELKDELARLKEELEENKANAEHNQKEQMDTKAEELQRMLSNSHKLVEEKLAIVHNLPKAMQAIGNLPSAQDMKELGKLEVEKEFQKRFREQERNHQKQLESVKTQYEQLVKEKEAMLSNMVKNFKENRKTKKDEISALRKEMTQLYELISNQKKVLNNIENGKYNQNLRKVYIPKDMMPEFPTPETFPHLFKSFQREKTETNVSAHKPATKQEKSEIQPSGRKIGNYCLIADMSTVPPNEAKRLVENLRELYKQSEAELENAKKNQSSIQEQKAALQEQIKNAKEERDRYRELYSKEMKQKCEAKSIIEIQRKTLEKNYLLSNERGQSRSSNVRPTTGANLRRNKIE
ncbi:unnamed protein product [Blepharisma stoltei]|uniref:Kinesin-like protein n=1 Tax=Blepharisma stoltei TaxID=1481888 RepID=A0AAU9JHI0_9CILI|nr:unnamed protein product [Blepharisma stoltei]